MQKLIIEDDEGKTVVVPLIRDEITIGRREGNTVRLTEQNISRRHARLLRENGVLSVEDLGSYNGITVNGLRIKQKQALKDGDEIAIGDYKFGFKADKAAETLADRTLGYEAAVPFAKTAPAVPVAAPPPAELAQEMAAAPPPEEEIDGSPTIPVRTLADQERDQPGAALVGKLVVVSSALQGHEFLLDKPSLVVGRTPENDVVLNHKSISRHHAKIIRDGAHFVIVDLESANGVRVNGNSEERSQLDHGDTIELGHVRMRFLAGANADSAAALAEFRTSRKPILIGGVAAAAVAVVLVVLLGGGKGGESSGPAAVTAAAPVASAPPAALPPPPPEKTAEQLLAEAKQASAAGNWDEALGALRKAAALAPASAEVAALAAQVEAERTGAEKLTIVKSEVAAGNFAAARTAADEIPNASTAKSVAGDLVNQGQADFIAAHLRAADEHRAAGACVEAKAEVALVTALEPGNPAAKEVVALCKPARRRSVAAARRPEPRPPAPRRTPVAAAPRPEPAPVAASEAAAEGDPDEFIRKAQDAWLKGQYAAAIDSSRGALRLRPGMQRAFQIIAVCSCSLRDESAATKAYEKLDGKSRDLVKSLCQKNGIALD